ncbi:TPA: tail assembly protein [Providencia stuartii]|uniref:Bacteriophage lambda tail assembly protein I n=1 Tax=Providencia stuartii ATCC 25827 TaxID=471874 RepID=A0AA86YP38_PROST|nr:MULTISPECIES: tail assembly protein [Providencia]APG50231.1 phage tail protein [Providencia stuartii]EDU57611.1 bacteriophage lambda tail assembly protein I [Providencia stuartii ATCC 25827]MDT2041124.1 tail assembly protein [Providencia stuartii]WAZ79883.1 tail assembly protein [Providencia stuartii]WAZ82892.1 tail assembly protein [Providencia stuartii]
MSLKTIRLYGVLGAKFGREHKLDIDSPREAIKALSVLYDGFEQFLANAHLKGLEFAVFKGKRNISEDELHLDTTEDIRIAPIIKGSKRGGFFQTVLGIAMIGLAVWNPAFLAMSATTNSALMLGGAAMAIGGIVQMLSPQPRGLSIRQDADNKPSYAFGGTVNTTAQGNPVPLFYGLDRREIGGAIISAGIYTEDQQ